jgi:hypothetical protein
VDKFSHSQDSLHGRYVSGWWQIWKAYNMRGGDKICTIQLIELSFLYIFSFESVQSGKQIVVYQV